MSISEMKFPAHCKKREIIRDKKIIAYRSHFSSIYKKYIKNASKAHTIGFLRGFVYNLYTSKCLFEAENKVLLQKIATKVTMKRQENRKTYELSPS